MSEIEIPGAQPLPAAPAGERLTIVRGTAALATAEVRQLGPYQMAGDALLFHRAGVARYLVDSGRTITVEAEPGAREEDVAAMLVATAIPAALWMRGHVVMHAAGAVLPAGWMPGEFAGIGTAVALAGPSGSGKTVQLQALMRQGAQVLADDTLCLRVQAERVQASGLPGSLQIRTGAGVDAGRAYVPVYPLLQQESAGLRLVCVPGPEPVPTRLRGPAALAALLKTLHRPRVPELLRTLPAVLTKVAELACVLPVYSCQSWPAFLEEGPAGGAGTRAPAEQFSAGDWPKHG